MTRDNLDVVALLLKAEARRFSRSVCRGYHHRYVGMSIALLVLIAVALATYLISHVTSMGTVLDQSSAFNLAIYVSAIVGSGSFLLLGGELWRGRLAYGASVAGIPGTPALVSFVVLLVRQSPIAAVLLVVLGIMGLEVGFSLFLLGLLLVLCIDALLFGMNLALVICLLLGRWNTISVVFSVVLSSVLFLVIFQIADGAHVGGLILPSHEASRSLDYALSSLMLVAGILSLSVLGTMAVILFSRRPITFDMRRGMPVKTFTSPVLWRGSSFVTTRLVVTRLSRSPKVQSLFGVAVLVAFTFLVSLLWEPKNGAMWTAPVLQIVSVCLGSALFVSLGAESQGRYPEILRLLGSRKLTLSHVLICILMSLPILLILIGASSKLQDWTVLLGAVVLLSIALPSGAMCGWMLQPVMGSSMSESSGLAILFGLVAMVPLVVFATFDHVIWRCIAVGSICLLLLAVSITLGGLRLTRV